MARVYRTTVNYYELSPGVRVMVTAIGDVYVGYPKDGWVVWEIVNQAVQAAVLMMVDSLGESALCREPLKVPGSESSDLQLPKTP
jgi:hypothetical protein